MFGNAEIRSVASCVGSASADLGGVSRVGQCRNIPRRGNKDTIGQGFTHFCSYITLVFVDGRWQAGSSAIVLLRPRAYANLVSKGFGSKEFAFDDVFFASYVAPNGRGRVDGFVSY